ncbi:MAG: TonB-dependent receptor [Bacteroides sp.]|nr:TonB-dependent receptor [Bacteroides sp.]
MDAKKLILFMTLFGCQAYAQEAADSLTYQLQEIVVNANQPATKLVGSTLVTTIPGSNLANLGTAIDVLSQLPMIKVDDLAVSVIGKNNAEIYIDGRPMRDELELQQILSTNLQTIEVLMSPGAAYDSTTDAVIRITTKPGFIQGFSLTDQFRLQCRRKWSMMDYLSLSYRVKRWEFFINGVFNHNNSLSKGETVNSLVYNNEVTTVGSSQLNHSPSIAATLKGGFNYSHEGQSFGAYYRYNPERGRFKNTGAEWIDDFSPIERVIHNRIRAHGHLISAYYENTFADKYKLHFDGDFSRSFSSGSVKTFYPESSIADVNSADERESSLLAGKLTLEFPLWKGEFIGGTQASFTQSALDFRMLNAQVGEYIPSAKTDARQASSALFASWSRMFGKLSLSVGARYEFVDYDFSVDGTRDENISRRDHLLTPDFSLGYSFNDDSQISFSYKSATVRPPYSQLTGALSYVGSHEIEGGNAALRDERMHDFQLFSMWRGLMMQADFTRANDTYAFIKEVHETSDLQLIMHPVNIDVSALSVFLIWSQPVKFWTPNLTLGVYRQWLEIDGIKHNKPIFSYYFDNTISLPRDWSITANIGGRSQGDMHTNRFGATWFTMDASVNKSLLNNALTLKLSATDIFNTSNHNWTMNTGGIFVDKRQSYDYRGVSLSIIYNLNPRKSQYHGASASQSELDRL